MKARTVGLLFVEDNPGDVALVTEAMREIGGLHHLSVVSDGEQAMAYLRGEGRYAGAPRPHLILLDLNLPRKDGRELLEEVKADRDLRHIPVIVFTSSQAEKDTLRAYGLNANAYVTKPADFDGVVDVMRAILGFWLTWVKLPAGPP